MRIRSHRYSGQTWTTLAAAVVGCATAAPVAHADDMASLLFDLRVQGTGGKIATVSQPGDVVQLDLYASLAGLDADSANDRVQSAKGSLLSSTGGLRGDLLGLGTVAPFTASGSFAGQSRDVDGDGDLDIGDPVIHNSTTHFGARSSPVPATQPPEGFLLGRFGFTAAGGLAPDSRTELRYQNAAINTSFVIFIDGSTAMNYSFIWSGRLNLSSVPVFVRATLPGSPAPTAISGAFSAHHGVTGHEVVAVGQSLDLQQGVSVAAGASLGAALTTVSTAINDAISGNAGGLLVLRNASIGASAAGTFTQSGGTSQFYDVSVGAGAAAAHLVVTGGAFQSNVLKVANQANATIEQSGGTLRTGVLQVDGGAVRVSNGAFAVASTAVLGDVGPASFVQTGGTVAFPSTVRLGKSRDTVVRVEGGQMTGDVFAPADTSSIYNLVQTGGAIDLKTSLTFRTLTWPPSSGGMRLEAGTLSCPTVHVGFVPPLNGPGIVGDGTFVQTGGSANVSGTLNVAGESAGGSHYDLSGGTLNAATINIGIDRSPNSTTVYASSGLFNQSGGDVVVTTRASIGANGRYTMTGGTLTAKELRVKGVVDLGNAPVTLSFGDRGWLDCWKGQLRNAQAATITAGVGSLLSFPAGFDPANDVGSIHTQGVIWVAGKPIVIPQGNTMGGSVSVEADVINGGTVAPGNSPGRIGVTGNFTQLADGTFAIEVGGTGTDQFDALAVSGSAALDGFLSVSLLDGYVPASTASFHIIATAAGTTGSFRNLNSAGQIEFPGGRFDLVYASNGVTLTNFSTLPEPGGVVSVAIALGAIVTSCRRSRHDD